MFAYNTSPRFFEGVSLLHMRRCNLASLVVVPEEAHQSGAKNLSITSLANPLVDHLNVNVLCTCRMGGFPSSPRPYLLNFCIFF
jgi:hypothetical protein